MSITGNCSLNISSTNLDFDLLGKLNLTPTSVVGKGDFLTSKRKALYDVWIFEIQITNTFPLNNALESIAGHLSNVRHELSSLKSRYDVSLNCYLRSDYAQMGIDIAPEILKSIAELELGLQIHILSFGGVDS
ncbi:DUF4279 domain-containing protein [Paenibacillus alvei]|uniref:DUF4279 domain-containing protein n=1 Tax=Paenibacillus alvei TaxID=44250 RepID=UPI0018CF6591|nr:DUF4279 domain-containing protein [Paenibacillus alvei]MBG9732865.1 hypothetical protein [Paenibacillus alvei]MBG9745880.1 hypothetical protein [Paenibacillus alvei]MCY9583027.1 DUF4279 domain-containing protein [Paenibacillus alvei]MCY9588384.1 DUF4279 domain-containing protein [Paenibacillus alvei]